MKKGILTILLALLPVLVFAQEFTVIGKEGKIFDEPNAKYVTLNQENNEVMVVPGMVFKTIEHKPGWLMIEYSPGIHAYISEQLVTDALNEPVPGSFKVQNNSSVTLSIEKNGSEWLAKDKNSYKGKQFGNVVLFFDASGNPAYSYVDLGNGGIVMSYDNNVTHFF